MRYAITDILLMAHLVCDAPLLVLKKNKKIVSSGAPGDSAPLLVDIVMAHLYKVRHYYVYDLVKLSNSALCVGAPLLCV